MVRHYILRQVALAVNKFSVLDNAVSTLKILRDPAQTVPEHGGQGLNVTPVVFWIAKALLMRLLRTEEVLEHVLGLLSDSQQGAESAKGFGLLLSRDEILSKENGVVDRLLAKQKVFNICVPRIVEDFGSAGAYIKPNYLVALSGILRNVPAEVMMTEIGTLLPLLLQSLDLENQHVKAASIESLLVVCQENPSVVEGHVSSLVSRLLQSATKSHQNIPVRFDPLRSFMLKQRNIRRADANIGGSLLRLEVPCRSPDYHQANCGVASQMESNQRDYGNIGRPQEAC